MYRAVSVAYKVSTTVNVFRIHLSTWTLALDVLQTTVRVVVALLPNAAILAQFARLVASVRL